MKIFSSISKGIRKFFSPIFSCENREKGLLPIWAGIVIIIGLVTAAAISEDDFFGLSGVALDLLKALIRGICVLLRAIGHALAVLAGNLLNNVVGSSFLTQAITKQPTLMMGWSQVRDLANMFIVLALVFIGICFALRISEYGSKKVLISLILVALLINFSGLFVGMIIDGSNLITLHFMKGGGDIGNTMVKGFDDTYDGMDWDALRSDADQNKYISAIIMFAVAYFLIAIDIFYLVVTLIARQALFSIFFILSPLAFFCWVLPQTRKLWTMWWENFIKWALIGAQIAFFLWLALTMMSSNNIGTTEGEGALAFLAIIILLYAAVKVAKASSGIGAGAIMGLAGGALGFAAGAAGGLAKGGAKVLDKRLLGGAGSAAADKVKSGYGRAMERLGLRQTGATAAANSKQVDEKAGLLSKEYAAAKATGNQGAIDRIQRQARNGRGAEGAAAMKVMNNAGDLHDVFKDSAGNVDYSQMRQRLVYGEKAGAGDLKKEAVNKYHELAGLDESKVAKELGVLGLPDTAANRARAQSSVSRKQLEKNWAGMDTSARASIDLSNLHSDDAKEFILSRTGEDLKAFRSSDAAHPNRTIIRGLIPDITAAHTAAAGNVNKQRRLKELEDVAGTI